MQFFKPENYFEVREALIQAGRGDLIGGCDGLIPANPPKEAIEARRRAGERRGAERPLPHGREPGGGRSSQANGPSRRCEEPRLPAGAEVAGAPAQARPRAETHQNRERDDGRRATRRPCSSPTNDKVADAVIELACRQRHRGRGRSSAASTRRPTRSPALTEASTRTRIEVRVIDPAQVEDAKELLDRAVSGTRRRARCETSGRTAPAR